jgi:phosphomevalonate kinase
MTVSASAPGKIVLSGEYAVLWDAPAVCMAVNRRAVAHVSPSADGECHLVTPGFDGMDRYDILDALLCGERPANRFALDTTAFFDDGRKTGIGSSAALTVALAAAINGSSDVAEVAMTAHRRLQGGKGSGVDIAAAVHGGLIEYTRSDARVRALRWPEGLAYRVIWTGVPASTERQLARLAAAEPGPSRSALLLAAPRMRDAWRSGDAAAVLSEYVPYIGVLRQFSIDHDLGIFDAGHHELTDAAMVDGLVYKPAGAGGGDIGMLFGRSEDDLDAFLHRHARLVTGVIDCVLDPAGVRLEAA